MSRPDRSRVETDGQKKHPGPARRSPVWIATVGVSIVMVFACVGGIGGGGGGSSVAPIEVVVSFDAPEYCVDGDMTITATIPSLDGSVMEGANIGADQTQTVMDWVIFQVPPGGGTVTGDGSTPVTNSYSHDFSAGTEVGTGEARARVELIVQDEEGNHRTIVAQGESETVPYEVKQCVAVSIDYAGIFIDEGGEVTESAKMEPVALTGPPEGPLTGTGTLNLEVERNFTSDSGECHTVDPAIGSSAVDITAEFDEGTQLLTLDFNFQPGVASSMEMYCTVQGQSVSRSSPPNDFDPGDWGLVGVMMPLSQPTKHIGVDTGFSKAVGDGAITITVSGSVGN